MSSPVLAAYVDLIKGLHTDWTPHAVQVTIGKKLFNDNIRRIFLQCGRKLGKTELVCYMLCRWAQANPGSSCYYISPYQKQSKEIVWANHRVQTFGPRSWLKDGSSGINNTELRLNFKNGSFIKLDGSDNYDAYRGIEPHFMVYEEFAQFRPEFHIAMEPNLVVFNAPLIIIGTPPDVEGQYTQMAEEFRKNPKCFWYRAPSYENPHMDRAWLDTKKLELEARGESDVWQREYEAIFVPGGISKIFPMLDRTRHVKPHAELLREIERDRKRLDWYVVADPAAATTFAVLFLALNRYTKRWYVLREIYEQDQNKMSVEQIGRRIRETKTELGPDLKFDQVYDEAESWFRNEIWDRFQEHFVPTHKSLNDKESGLSIIKDAMLHDKIVISDTCTNLFEELDKYMKDRNGKIPKKKDHLIDCLRYAFGASLYQLKEEREIIGSQDENFRGARIEDDFPQLQGSGAEWDVNVKDLWS